MTIKNYLIGLIFLAAVFFAPVISHTGGGGAGCVGILCNDSHTGGLESVSRLMSIMPRTSGAGGVALLGAVMGVVTEKIGGVYGSWVDSVVPGGSKSRYPSEQILYGIGEFGAIQGVLSAIPVAGRATGALWSRARAMFANRGVLPTLPDLLMPSKMVLAVDEAYMAQIPKRVVDDVDSLLGNKLGSGVQGQVYDLKGDPASIIKKYYGPVGEDNLARAHAQIRGLESWRRDIARVGLQDRISVVETLEYGIDAQGHAFTIHPKITGTLSNAYMPPAQMRELLGLKKIIFGGSPDYQKAIQAGLHEDYLIRTSIQDNFFRTPSGMWKVIDPL